MMVRVVAICMLLVPTDAFVPDGNSKNIHALDPPPPAPSPQNLTPQRGGKNNRSSVFLAMTMESKRLAPRLDVAGHSERFGSCSPLLKEILKGVDQSKLQKLEQLEMAEFDAQNKRLFLSARLWYELFSQGAITGAEVQAKALREIHDVLQVLRWYEPKFHFDSSQRLAKAQAEYTQSKLRDDEQRRRLEELAAAVHGYNKLALATNQPIETSPELPHYCAAQAVASVFAQQEGYVSKGDDLLVASMTADEATARCGTLPDCQSITFRVTPEFHEDPKGAIVEVYFKEKKGVHGGKQSGWQTYLRNVATKDRSLKGINSDAKFLSNIPEIILNAVRDSRRYG